MLVTNHCPGVIRLLKGKIELIPGKNPIADEDWQKVKTSKHVVELIAMKRLTVAAGGEVESPLPTETSAPQSEASQKKLTKEVNAKDAIILVKESDDADWLQSSLDDESRSTVTDAIYARMDELDILPD